MEMPRCMGDNALSRNRKWTGMEGQEGANVPVRLGLPWINGHLQSPSTVCSAALEVADLHANKAHRNQTDIKFCIYIRRHPLHLRRHNPHRWSPTAPCPPPGCCACNPFNPSTRHHRRGEKAVGLRKALRKCCTPGVTAPMVSLHCVTSLAALRAAIHAAALG